MKAHKLISLAVLAMLRWTGTSPGQISPAPTGGILSKMVPLATF
jgi:hypothetical protein